MAGGLDRRGLIGALAAGGAALAAGASASAAELPAGPRAVLVYTAVAQLEERVSHGITPYGERFRVPIIGGHFEGPDLKGRIVPGGADW